MDTHDILDKIDEQKLSEDIIAILKEDYEDQENQLRIDINNILQKDNDKQNRHKRKEEDLEKIFEPRKSINQSVLMYQTKID